MPQTVKKRRNALMWGTIALVVFFYSLYFFIYLPQRTELMNERGKRVLNQMSKGLEDRRAHYKSSLETLSCNYQLRMVVQYKEELLDPSISEAILNFYDPMIYCLDNHEAVMEMVIPMWEIVDEGRPVSKEELKKLYDIFLKAYEKLPTPDHRLESFAKDTSSYVLIGKILVFGDSTNIAISANNLLEQVERFDLFDDVILSDNHGNILDKSRLNLSYFNFDPSIDSGFTMLESHATRSNNGLKESLVQDETGYYRINNVALTRTKLAGENQVCFTKRISLSGKTYYLTGIIKSDSYYSNIREISVWLLAVIALLLLILLQIMPIIKPFVLSTAEQLRSRDVTWSGVAVVYGISVLALLVIGVDTFAIEELDLVDKKLHAHARRTAVDFDKELQKTVGEIEKVKGFYYRRIEDSSNAFTLPKNIDLSQKYLRIKPNGTARFFRIDKNWEDVILSDSINLSHRDYFKVLFGDSTQYAWKSTNGKPMYVESLLSLASGKHETVVAVKDSSTAAVAFASVFPLKSANNRYLEPGYYFAIIDREGNIQYHSDQVKIGNENFIKETEYNKGLIALLNNRSSKAEHIAFSLGNYRAFVMPVPNTPLFVVTMYDISKSRLNITQALTTSMMLVFALLAYLFVLHWIFKISKYLYRPSALNVFDYLLLNPAHVSPRVFLVLTAGNFALVFLLMWVYATNHLNLALAISAYFGTITIAIVLNFTILTQYELAKNSISYNDNSRVPGRFEGALLVLWGVWACLTLFSGTEIGAAYVLLIAQVCLFVIYIAIRVSRPFKEYLLSAPAHRNWKFVPFYWHTFSWVIMLGVVSCFTFFKPIYNHQHIKRSFAAWVEEYTHRTDNYLVTDRKVQLYKSSVEDIDTLHHFAEMATFMDDVTWYLMDDKEELYAQFDSTKYAITLTKGYDKQQKLPFFTLYVTPEQLKFKSVDVAPNTTVAFALPSLNPGGSYGKAIAFWVLAVFMLFGLYAMIVQLSQKFFYLKLGNRLRAGAVLYSITAQNAPAKEGENQPEEIVKSGPFFKSDFIDTELSFFPDTGEIMEQMKKFRTHLEKHRSDLRKHEIRELVVDALVDALKDKYVLIWQNCSLEEKMVLYDFAEDGLINSKNEKVIQQLVRKGIMNVEPSLRIFNSSFTRFLIREIPIEEAQEMRSKSSNEGVWKTYQYLAFLLIACIVVFLSLVERDALAPIIGGISLATALIPRLLTFAGSLGNPLTWLKKKPADQAE